MSIATEISRIQQAKADIKSSIEAKGVTVPSAALIDDYSDYVDAIQTGGGGDDSMEHYLNNTLTSYTIPAGVTSLHNYCFSHLTNLKSLTLNNDLTTIGENAFEYTNIENITFPSSVTNVKEYALSNNSSLKTVIFKGNVLLGTRGHSGVYLFNNTPNLEKIVYEGNIEIIGQLRDSSDEHKNVFLTTVGPLGGGYNIEYNFSVLPEYFLAYFYWIEEINLTGVTELNSYSISNIYYLPNLLLPSTLTKINGNGFSYMHLLKEIEFEGTTPPTWANYNYTTCFDIIVPDESVEVYKTAYPNAANRIFSKTSKPVYHQTTQLRYSNQTGTSPFTELTDTVLTTTNVPSSNLRVAYISDNVTEIGDNVFKNQIEQVWISPNNHITKLGNNTLYYVYSDISLPYVETIGNYALNYFKGKTIAFGNSLTTIGSNFMDYSTANNVAIPDSVTSIGINAFYSSTFENMTLGKNVSITDFLPKCVNLNIRIIDVPNKLFRYKRVENITFENTVRTIGKEAFRNMENLKTVTFDEGVTSIGENSFAANNKITQMTIPNSVVSIDANAFETCASLANVTIGNGIATIGNSAFRGCSSLTSVTCFATTPPTLGSYVFYNTNNCPIYVPAESVEAYKAATNWSTYASRIQAIPTE